MLHSLTTGNVISPKEKAYFVVALLVAILIWGFLTLMTLGMIWPFLILIAVFAWFSNGLLVAGLKADAVAVHPNQLGPLDAALRSVCQTLQVKVVPELYVIQSGGLLNAFATRHSGRHFVVVYSDMLEAFGPDSAEMKFLLGHEVGHIQRNHLLRRVFLAPALFFPLIGAAYSRACESTCDRYGALASGSLESSLRAMMTLAGGKAAGREMDPLQFAQQNKLHRGFFVSWYELISGYPTLSRRMKDLAELETGRRIENPPRHPLAYLFALGSFGGGFGGRGSILTTLVVFYFIFLFAALAIPAISGAMKRAQEIQQSQQASEQSMDP